MAFRKLAIEDTSDCESCTQREAEGMALLGEVKCEVLEGVICPECGRRASVLARKE